MKFQVICNYCGHQMVRMNVTAEFLKWLSCEKCGDKKLRARPLGTSDVFGYGEERKPDAYIDVEDDGYEGL